MQTLGIEYDIPWLPTPNEVHMILDDTLPPCHLITSSLAFAFAGDRFLMTRLVERDWDIPGGHIEAGESAEEAMRREVYEETGAQLGDVALFAQQKFVIHAPKPTGYKYPHPVSHQVFYLAQVVALDAFDATAESHERRLFAPAEARQMPWVHAQPEIYETTLQMAVSRWGTSHIFTPT